MSPLALMGQQQWVQTLLQEYLLILNRDGSKSSQRHMDQLLAMCDMHSINHGDFLVRVFLQNLVGLASYWFWSLLASSITCFKDLEDVFFTRYTKKIDYHNLTQLAKPQMQRN
jgi:hypothetical protein